MRRIVLDTNCLLMCVSSQSPYHKVWTEFVEGKVAWCVSTEILSEYMELLEQKTNAWFAEVIVNAIVNNKNTIRDLNHYKEIEIEQCINAFGYTIVGDKRFIDIKKEEGYAWQQLCCECLFEEMIPELLS